MALKQVGAGEVRQCFVFGVKCF
uniref:Uncharacterized protein n=1 Tax=Rhizophora mucronata TaxID=61149 RepID=A0A2P2N4S5_RHIMU